MTLFFKKRSQLEFWGLKTSFITIWWIGTGFPKAGIYQVSKDSPLPWHIHQNHWSYCLKLRNAINAFANGALLPQTPFQAENICFQLSETVDSAFMSEHASQHNQCPAFSSCSFTGSCASSARHEIKKKEVNPSQVPQPTSQVSSQPTLRQVREQGRPLITITWQTNTCLLSYGRHFLQYSSLRGTLQTMSSPIFFHIIANVHSMLLYIKHISPYAHMM